MENFKSEKIDARKQLSKQLSKLHKNDLQTREEKTY